MSQFDAQVQNDYLTKVIEDMRASQLASDNEIARLAREAEDREVRMRLLHDKVSTMSPPNPGGRQDIDEDAASSRSKGSRASAQGQFLRHGIGASSARLVPSNAIVKWEEGKCMEVESPELRNWRVETTKTLGSCRIYKFTGKYWTQWKSLVISALQSVKLEHLLTTNYQLGIDATQGDIAEYQATQTCARNFIYMYLSTELISDLNGVSDVFGIWKKLRDTYENRSVK
jgi:hypothetical protein